MAQKNLNMFGEMIAKVNKSVVIRAFIIVNVKDHPTDIARLVKDRFKISRVTAVRHLQDLIQEGVLEATGKTKDRRYKLHNLVDRDFVLEVTPKLQEDVVWTDQIKPLLAELPENVLGICAHGFTEMLNNVIDHSESTTVLISIVRNAAQVEIKVLDKGIGIFRHIQEECKL
ncbi:MAG: winged helix DNA-binding protein, partial [Nitrospirota bacterium]